MVQQIIRFYKKNAEIINYLIVGGLTTVVSLASYYAATGLFFDAENPFQLQIANVLSWIVTVAFAYFANRWFVFKSKNENMLREAASFVTSRVTTLLLDMAGMFCMVSLMHLNDKIAKIVVAVVVTVANYVFSKLFVFK